MFIQPCIRKKLHTFNNLRVTYNVVGKQYYNNYS